MLPFQRIESDPRNESFFDMFYQSFCPKFEMKSCTFIIFLIISCFYIYGVLQSPNPQQFLSINQFYLTELGAIVPQYLLEYSVWRVFIAPFLVSDFMSYCIYVLFILSMGSSIEYLLTKLVNQYGRDSQRILFASRVLLGCWLISAIAGGFTQAYFSSPLAIITTMQCSLLGMLGVILAFIVINYDSMMQQYNSNMMCCLVILVLMVILLGKDMATIAGNISALAVGTLYSLYLLPSANGEYQQQCKKVGLYGMISEVVFVVFVFYLMYGRK